MYLLTILGRVPVQTYNISSCHRSDDSLFRVLVDGWKIISERVLSIEVGEDWLEWWLVDVRDGD